MRIVVVGAYGLVGGYVTARLLSEGHEVIGVGRDVVAAKRRFQAVRWVQADIGHMQAGEWRALLPGVHAVVNCAGALQDSPRDDLRGVHLTAVKALIQACERSEVRRIVHISAVGVERSEGAFQSTKAAAEEALRTSDLEWVILRPGLVLAPAAYGGSALLRGLAAFPLFIPAAHPDAVVQTVSIDDVTEAVSRSVRPETPTRFTCDLVSADPTSLRELLTALRAWLGFSPVPVIAVPSGLAAGTAAIADGLAWFGWRSPMRTAAVRQLAIGVVGEADEAQRRLSMAPRTLARTLAVWPTGVQERWYARLYFLKPGILTVLAGFWAISGSVGLADHSAAARLLINAGLPSGLAQAFVFGGSFADLCLAALTCWRATVRAALSGMILVTIAYLAGAVLWTPWLWSDPLGPLVKSIPAAVLALAALALLDER